MPRLLIAPAKPGETEEAFRIAFYPVKRNPYVFEFRI